MPSDQALFDALNKLNRPTVTKLQQVFEGVLERFSPLNLLRYEILNQLDEGKPPLTPAYVDFAAEKIEERNIFFFEKYGSTKLTEGLANQQSQKPFQRWTKNGKLKYQEIFEPFFLPEYNTPNIISTPNITEPTSAYLPNYTIADALQGVFLNPTDFDEMVSLLQRKKNLIVQGSPGVGKTFIARRLALLLARQPSGVEMVQFHQSYSYEDFIQGYRPDGHGSFCLCNGVFYQLCERAKLCPQQNFVLIIDEINRGNLSKIFGELLLLLEANKRQHSQAIRLTYSPNQTFYIPANVYVIGTMNAADRSLTTIDYALRRRFAFADLNPQFNKAFEQHWQSYHIPTEFTQTFVSIIAELNECLASDRHLGKGFQIGHSFFVNPPDDYLLWYNQIIRYEIAPLLHSYWFDDDLKAERWIKRLMLQL
jgi:AAA domain (dynein-related subfamily)